MISFFNKLGNSWFAKVIFLTLAISMMAVWGLGGFLNTDVQSNIAVKVGKEEITIQKLLNDFSEERIALSRQMGGVYISPKKAMEMGLLQKVIEKDIQESLQRQILQELDLIASEQDVAVYLEKNPAFHDMYGKFDPQLFRVYLNVSGLTEQALLKKLKHDLAWKQLSDSVLKVSYADDVMKKLMYHYQNDAFDIAYVDIDPKKIVLPTQPTAQELQDYYDAYLEDFMVPEKRKIQVLEFSDNSLKNELVIEDSELESIYEEQKDTYVKPEKRLVSQMYFSSEEEAQQAVSKLNKDNFEEFALEKGLKKEEVDFGWISVSDVLPEIADAIFKTEKNKITSAVQTNIGWQVFLVKDIQKASVIDKAKAKEEIKQALIKERLFPMIQDKIRQSEDLLGEGKSFAEVVERVGIHPKEYTVEMNVVYNKELPQDLNTLENMQQLFKLSSSDTSSVIEGEKGGYIVHIADVYPLHKKEFEDVKSEINQKVISQKQKELVSQKADEILDLSKKKGRLEGREFDKKEQKSVTRSEIQSTELSLLLPLLELKEGIENAQVISSDGKTIVGYIGKIHVAEDDETLKKSIETEKVLKQVNADNLMLGLTDYYRKKFSIEVDEELIQKVFSQYQTSQDE